MRAKSLIVTGLLLIAGAAGAEEATTITATAPSAPSEARIIGGVELRPSWRSLTGELYSEDYAQLGWQFSKSTQLFYRQQFNTNLYNPGTTISGLEPTMHDGSLRAKVNDIYKFTSALGFSYEGRLYLPTQAAKRDAGMIAALRTYLKVKQDFAGGLASVSLEEIPIAHFYDRAGTPSSKGGAANPAFENCLTLAAEVKPMKGLKLYVPLMLNSTRYRAFAEKAKNNDAWGHKVWLYPELTYAVSSNATLGLAYYSDNLIQSDFGGTTLTAGLEKGVTQVIVTATL